MIQFSVLGPVTVWRDGLPVRMRSAMLRQLLAALLCRPGRPVSVAELIEAVWPGGAPASARKALQVHVHRLRRVLGDDGRINHQAGAYLAAVGPTELDALRFVSLAAEGRDARRRGDPDLASRLLGEARQLWRGAPYSGVDAGTLVADAVRRLAEAHLLVLGEWFAAELQLGRHTEIVAALGDAVDANPYHERFREQLMVALHRAGRQVEALAVFRDTRALLVEQLGIEPGESLHRLHAAMLRGDASVAVPPEPGAAVVSVHARPAAPVPRQLPGGPTAFVGRRAQLAALGEMVDDRAGGSPVIAAITGTAGVGKTALALHWAHSVLDRFGDGQLYLNLCGYAEGTTPTRPTDALRRFLRSLGIDAAVVPGDDDEAAALYRSLLAGRQVLVVLDNAASAEQVRPLLPGSSTCTVLITSRHRLGDLVAQDGARPLPLDVLAPDEAYALLERVLGVRRVAAEPGATAELARSCANLPLALRVAAANLTDRDRVSIAEYVATLAGGNPLSELHATGDERSAVRTAFELSYVGLPAAARCLFRRLCLVPGPDFGLPGAAALMGLPVAEARRLVDRLCAAHLVAEHRPGRYAMHDLLRSYAAERAADDEPADERHTAARRQVDFYVQTTHATYPVLLPRRDDLPRDVAFPPVEPLRFADRDAALAWHDDERENLVGVVRQAATNGWHTSAWQLADSLFAYFHLRRHWPDWITAASTGLACAHHLGDRRAAARMHNALGVAHKQIGSYPMAQQHYLEALRLATEIGYTRLAAGLRVNLAGLHITEGDPQTALGHLTAALADPDYGRDPSFATITYLNLGCALLELDRYVAAADALSRALDMADAAGDAQNACHAHHNLAEVELRRGDLTAALRHADRQVGLAATIRDPLRRAAALDMRASCLAHTDLAAARTGWSCARDMFRALHHPLGGVLDDWLRTIAGDIDPAAVTALDAARRSAARRLI